MKRNLWYEKSHLLLLYQWNSTIKNPWQLIAQGTLYCYFPSNVSIRILGSSRFQLYVEFYLATNSLHNKLLLSHFDINIKTKQKKAFCIGKDFCWLLLLFNLYAMFTSWSSSYLYFLSSLLPACCQILTNDLNYFVIW